MRRKVVLACAKCLSRNYSTDKNKSENSGRLEVRKFCKRCGAHTLHRETK
ncbi:50S ribosomal protein L33 [Sediminibacillus albus]|uniref:Large ribosomal subunit protein bL33 n=1 Tax=Sediminibacillus albus TaxID=407036 RepID=A0A1G9D3V3_9BACI|nr:50S ribosomal protein L33 [Sediminibacillus albus]SDK58513.1 large subunit ribosomal protein L33 [Sediminibacillus albus]